MEVRLLIAAALLGGGACSRAAGPAATGGGALVIADTAAAGAALGHRVRVEGTAANDKLSAVIETGRLTVYCLDVAGWPPDRVGRPAAIEGTLERTDELEARDSDDGLAAQGTIGAIYVIRRCTIAP